MLGLDLSEDGDLLFSSGGDSVVNVSGFIYLSTADKLDIRLMDAGLVDEDICSSLFHPLPS